MNSWSIEASLLIEGAQRPFLWSARIGILWALLFLEVGSWSLGTSSLAIFLTTSRGICSKCVWDFRVASFGLVIHEQYLSARHTGHFL